MIDIQKLIDHLQDLREMLPHAKMGIQTEDAEWNRAVQRSIDRNLQLIKMLEVEEADAPPPAQTIELGDRTITRILEGLFISGKIAGLGHPGTQEELIGWANGFAHKHLKAADQ